MKFTWYAIFLLSFSGCGSNKQYLTPSFKIDNLNPSITLNKPICYYNNESAEYTISIIVANTSNHKVSMGHVFTSFFTRDNLVLETITDEIPLDINPGSHKTVKLLFNFAPSEIPEKIEMASKP